MMPILDTKAMDWREKRPGWKGAIFSSPSMTFAHWRFSQGAAIHEHGHEQEEVWHLIEGELEVVVDGVASRVGAGSVIILPANTPHAVTALTDGFAIVADYPLRERF
jgi:quercetin dioxygenase-like cupin family protein